MPTQFISSTKNPRIAAVAELRERKARLKQNLFLIEGAREIDRALNARFVIKELYVCRETITADAEKIIARANTAELVEVSPAVYAKLAMREGTDGVVAVAETKVSTWDALPRNKPGLVFVLEGVEKPGNLGAFLRSADGAGVDLVVVLDDSADLFNPHVVRASVGAVFTMPVIWTDHQTAWNQLKAANYVVYAASPFAKKMYFEAPLAKASALVLGSEAKGLSDFWENNGVQTLKVPMLGQGDSLNVATTGAILAYDARRQRLS